MKEHQKIMVVKEIETHRLKHNKTQQECADILNVPIQTYMDLENNPSKFDIDQILKLSTFLNWDFFNFFLKYVLQNAK